MRQRRPHGISRCPSMRTSLGLVEAALGCLSLGGGGLRGAETHAQPGVAHTEGDGVENTSLLGPGLQKEPFLCLLCKHINFISEVLSPPPLVDTYPVGPACLSCLLNCLDLSGLFNLGAIVFSHVKTLRWDTSWGTSTKLVKLVSLWS